MSGAGDSGVVPVPGPVERCRRVIEEAGSLDRLIGDDISVRWVLQHMLEEYARHNGHADLLREAIDGSTGE